VGLNVRQAKELLPEPKVAADPAEIQIVGRQVGVDRSGDGITIGIDPLRCALTRFKGKGRTDGKDSKKDRPEQQLTRTFHTFTPLQEVEAVSLTSSARGAPFEPAENFSHFPSTGAFPPLLCSI
jgi:hypothetical protein